MPCTEGRFIAVASLQLKDPNMKALAKAIELLYPNAQVQWTEALKRMTVKTENGWTTLEVKNNGVDIQGKDMYDLQRELPNAYAAIVRAAAYKAQNMQVSVKKEGDRIRIIAEN